MRKWMRDRLQRRKKSPAAPSDQPTPPPLQPAYFDAEQAPGAEKADSSGQEAPASPAAPSAPDRDDPSVRSARVEEPNLEAEPGTSPASMTRSSSGGRSRRRRGGRGRGGRGREQAVASAFTPAAVKGSIPVVAPGSAEEEMPEAEGEGEAAEPAAVQPQAVATVAAAAARPPKGVVVLAIGLPGSGKSSWFKRHNVVPLSSDMVRALLFDDVREQRFQDLVFSNLRSMLKARLIARRPTNYVDATNLTPQERQHWIKLAKDYQYEVHAVFFDVPLQVCLERHQRRDRVVPEDVMRRMAAKLKPPAFEEGFAKITVVRVKKKDAAAVEEP